MNRYKPVGWRNESHRHYLASKGIKSKYLAHKYFMALEPRMPVEEREKYISANIKKTPESERAEKVAELTALTEGLGKRGVDDVLEAHEMEYIPKKTQGEAIGEELWRAIGGSNVQTSARNAAFDRRLAESVEKSALETQPTKDTSGILGALIDKPHNVQFFDGSSVAESTKGPLKLVKVQTYTDRGEPHEIWHVEDSSGDNAVMVDYYPKRKHVETNSPSYPGYPNDI